MNSEIKYCIKCGHEIIDEANFCMNCGYNLSEEKNKHFSTKNDYKKYGKNTIREANKFVGDLVSNIITKGYELNEIIEESKEEVFSKDEDNKKTKVIQRTDEKSKNFDILFHKNTISSKIDLNINSANEINDILNLSSNNQKKLQYLKNSGYEFKSFSDFSYQLQLNSSEIDRIKPYIDEKYFKIDNTPNITNKYIINFNSDSKEQLNRINILNSEDLNKIIVLRNNGIEFNSFEDLKNKAEIDSTTINQLKKKVIIEKNLIINKPQKKQSNKLDFTSDKDIIENEEKLNKIDINLANQETLAKIPSINIIMAKKIIDLRNQGIFIKSYKDLEEKLNLKPQQITQIKELTTINKEKEHKRIMDI